MGQSPRVVLLQTFSSTNLLRERSKSTARDSHFCLEFIIAFFIFRFASANSEDSLRVTLATEPINAISAPIQRLFSS